MSLRAFLAASLFLAACAARRMADKPTPAPEATAAVSPPAAMVAAVSAPASGEVFEQRIRPLLARTCTPCHVPGGKMYERLPFDKPDVVRSNQDSILKRLKIPEDRQTLLDWLKL
jgi:hypothetical protein